MHKKICRSYEKQREFLGKNDKTIQKKKKKW